MAGDPAYLLAVDSVVGVVRAGMRHFYYFLAPQLYDGHVAHSSYFTSSGML